MAKFCPPFMPMAEILSNAWGEQWKITRFEMSDEVVAVAKATAEGNARKEREVEDLEPGWYVSLEKKENNGVWMSDTPMERRTCLPVVENAHGDVLIAGLGLGMILVPLVNNTNVHTITVVENDPEVIRLVEPQLRHHLGDMFRIENEDIFEFVPTGKYDTIWFDIWPTITPKNFREMNQLQSRFRRWLRRKGWMGSWRYADCEEMARIERKMEPVLAKLNKLKQSGHESPLDGLNAKEKRLVAEFLKEIGLEKITPGLNLDQRG